MRIEELGPPNADHSTGLILHWRGQLLFAVLPVDQWHDTAGGRLAYFMGIGGHVEAGESWGEAVRREAQEEAGIAVDLLSPAETWLLRDDGTVQDITAALTWPDAPRPLFVWCAVLLFDAPQGEQERHFVNAVFEAAIPDDVEPQPAAEVPALLALSEAQLRQAAVHPISLETLLEGGAQIWTSSPIPPTILIAPLGTAQWYDVWLQKRDAALL
jgi:8-oxo-dGTP pyrophosphatase MutT (NUDIX family)